jgi:hypothetical protein
VSSFFGLQVTSTPTIAQATVVRIVPPTVSNVSSPSSHLPNAMEAVITGAVAGGLCLLTCGLMLTRWQLRRFPRLGLARRRPPRASTASHEPSKTSAATAAAPTILVSVVRSSALAL